MAIHCNRRGCRKIHITRVFSHALCTCDHTHRGSRCLSAHFISSTCHPWCHMFERAFVVSSCLSLSCFSHTSTLLLSLSICSLSGTQSSMSSPPRVKTNALTRNGEYCTVVIYNPPTCYEPKLLDNFDYSNFSAVIFQNESVDVDTEPSYPCDAELDDELIGKALSSPLFIQEREEPANLGQAYHSHEESLFYIWQRRCLPTAPANVTGWGISGISYTCSWTAARFLKSKKWWCDYEWRYYASLMSLTRNNVLSSMLRCCYCVWQCSSESVHKSWALRWFLWISAFWCPSLITATANANNNEIRPQIHFW